MAKRERENFTEQTEITKEKLNDTDTTITKLTTTSISNDNDF